MAKKSRKQQKRRVENHEYAILSVLSLVIASIFVFSVFGFDIIGNVAGTFNIEVSASASCSITQNATITATAAGSKVTTNGSGGTPLRLLNDGNTNLNVTIQSNASASELFSESGGAFFFSVRNNESSSGTVNGSFDEWTTVSSSTDTGIITTFGFADSADLMQVDFNVTIPGDAASSNKTATITLTCTASDP
jgi:hypothetical protein